MAKKKFQLSVPRQLVSVLGSNQKAAEKSALQHIIMNMIHRRQITLSLGAEALKLSYRETIQLMKDNDIPLINYDLCELDEELAALQALQS